MSNLKIADDIAATIPGYVAGRWLIDPVHSDVSFIARHLVSKVRGQFRRFTGQIHTAENPLDSSVTVEIEAATIDTNNTQRDDHLRSADFLDVETYPSLTFSSDRLRPDGPAAFLITGSLTIKDVIRPITAHVELNGFSTDQDGNTRASYTATFEINRKDYNVNFHWILETGGAMVGDRVTIQLEVEAILQTT